MSTELNLVETFFFLQHLCLRVYFNQNFATVFEPFLQKWDASLKVVAEGYAAKCVWNHNPDLEDTGENLFVSTGTMDLREGMEKWFLGECRIGMDGQNLNQLLQSSRCLMSQQVNCDKDALKSYFPAWSQTPLAPIIADAGFT